MHFYGFTCISVGQQEHEAMIYMYNVTSSLGIFPMSQVLYIVLGMLIEIISTQGLLENSH